MSLLCELVKTRAVDGVRLDGAFYASAASPQTIVDAVVCQHGTASNFYSSQTLDAVTPALLDLGLSVLRVNSRSHDGLSYVMSETGRKLEGAAFENVDDCRYDIDAWCGFLRDRGFQRIGLLGHSMGAIKSIYAMAHEPELDVKALVAISPPRLAHSILLNGERGTQFAALLHECQTRANQGDADTLMSVDYPLPLITSPRSYLDKYGVDGKYDILKYVPDLCGPALFVYGSVELEHGGVPFGGMPDQITKWRSHDSIQVTMIEDADHFYSKSGPQLAAAISKWFTQLR